MNGRPEHYDQRTKAARRFRQLVADFSNDLGGDAKLSFGDRALVRQAAMACMCAEDLQAKYLRGESIDNQEIVRLTNAAARVLGQLGIKGRKRQTAHVPAWRQGE
jgi:hypothetical protein